MNEFMFPSGNGKDRGLQQDDRLSASGQNAEDILRVSTFFRLNL